MTLFGQKPFIQANMDTPKCCLGCGLHRPLFTIYGQWTWDLCYDCKTEMRNIGIEEWYRKNISKEESE
jgi:hypothetical protein